jgi:sulfonate transport system ATP-binding protein
MQRLIESLWREQGFTALRGTHDVAGAVALAGRVLLIEDGRIALDERVPLPRPRSRGNPQFAAIEERVLQRVLRETEPDQSQPRPLNTLLPDRLSA